MILKAHAKINLHLDVGAKRKDGYHSLKTLFQEISLHDTLHFSKTDGPIELTISPSMPRLSVGDNLIVRALQALKAKLKIKHGARVHLEKRIPMGAGLGGGSSDAAAALWGGWCLWKGKDPKRKPRIFPPLLLACAKKLGADVPFFLMGGTAWAEGIGDKLKRCAPEPRRWLVLVYPRVHVSTPEAYRLLDESRKTTVPRSPTNSCFNSFEPVIFPKYPAIARAYAALRNAGGNPVMMSGSGSTVFGFAAGKSQAERIAKSFERTLGDVILTHTISSRLQ